MRCRPGCATLFVPTKSEMRKKLAGVDLLRSLKRQVVMQKGVDPRAFSADLVEYRCASNPFLCRIPRSPIL